MTARSYDTDPAPDCHITAACSHPVAALVSLIGWGGELSTDPTFHVTLTAGAAVAADAPRVRSVLKPPLAPPPRA
jgi:hypothetical protein